MKNQSLMKKGNQEGAALIGALFFMTILLGLSQVILVVSFNESKLARNEVAANQAFQVAQSGAQVALAQMDILINNFLQTTVAQSSPSGVVTYAQARVNDGNGITWLVYCTRDNNVAVLTQNGEEAYYTQSAALDNGDYSYNITFAEKEEPESVGTDTWDFSFNYQVESEGTSEGLSQTVLISGDFTVRLQKDNFAKYALFTNNQTMPSGTNVWFTSRTNFSGPVHTNSRFNFAFNPSGTFYQDISQVEQTARFHNSGSSILLDADANGTTDVPTFSTGFSREANSITLDTATEQQDMVDQATNTTTYASDGIYVPAQGANLKGGVYVKGDSVLSLSIDASNNAVYTITQGSTTKIITVNNTTSKTTVENVSAGTSNTYNGLPDGIDDAGTIIYVDGNITSVSGTVQEQTALTIASSSDMVISGNLKYSDYTAGSGTAGIAGYVPPSADGAGNILGLVSWAGNVHIGTTAPNDVEIHASVLAENGVFQVDDYNSGSPRGIATLLGGAITNNYGAFGTFNSSTGLQVSGYGRNFVYDSRMQTGTAPPYFPTLETFIAFTNDITDKMVWQEGE
jgi:hypothetical protein